MSSKRRLSIEEARHLFRLDPETGHVFWSGEIYPDMWPTLKKWKGRRAGSVGAAGYRYIEITRGGERIQDFEHHVVWRLHYGEPPPECTDHADRNRTNNAVANLRAATRSDNARNRPRIFRDPSTTCRYKGIYLDRSMKRRKRYRAVIYIKKHAIRLGRYATEDEALEAYKRAALELHGAFATWE